MRVSHQNLFLNVEEFGIKNKSKPVIVFLHGFTGSSRDWQRIISELKDDYHCLAVDLIGHGLSSSPPQIENYSSESLNNHLLSIINFFELEKINLIGYSMGGRAALNYAVNFPHQLDGLILESTSVGITDDNERINRTESDYKLAEFIEERPLEEFVDYWMNLDIFNTQRRFSNSKLNGIKNDKLENNKIGLANSLRGFSTGVMPGFSIKLKNVNCKTLLISGELDSKYSELNTRIVKQFPNAEHKIIKNAGHNTHLEEPAEFLRIIKEFFDN